jgi:hypothetical protein
MSDDIGELQQAAIKDDLVWGTQRIADEIGKSLTDTNPHIE